jgi:UPF0176 protein
VAFQDSFFVGLRPKRPHRDGQSCLFTRDPQAYIVSMSNFIVAALYHFTRFTDPATIQGPLQVTCDTANVHGTLLLAGEGINGTIAGDRQGIDTVLAAIRALPGCQDFEHKESTATVAPFIRMKVRLKKEIVTMGQPQVDPTANVGNYVLPEDWNNLIAQDDVVLIDTRNDYEVAIGTFENAVDPNTASFRDFPKWWDENKDRFHNKRVAMFCTGGIRCEKSTNYLIGEGVKDVYHLKGGILKYLEEVPENQSHWNGECFVFDARVSVGHGLAEGPYHLCYACRRPISDADMNRPDYELGVSCYQCIDEYDEGSRIRFRERQKQVKLSAERGEQHIGPNKT